MNPLCTPLEYFKILNTFVLIKIELDLQFKGQRERALF